MPDIPMTDDPEDAVDALARLRAANPVPPDEVAALSTTARARALRAEIVMQTESNPRSPESTSPHPAPTGPRWQRPLVAGLAAVLLTAVGTVAALQLAADEPAPADVVAGDQVEVDPIMPGGGMALCVATYTPETLVEREVAFLGTVTAIEGDEVTFEVEEAFRGTAEGPLTLGGAEFLSTPNPDNVNPIAVGERYLVAGDGGFAWGCGFTHLHSEELAEEWRAAFTD